MLQDSTITTTGIDNSNDSNYLSSSTNHSMQCLHSLFSSNQSNTTNNFVENNEIYNMNMSLLKSMNIHYSDNDNLNDYSSNGKESICDDDNIDVDIDSNYDTNDGNNDDDDDDNSDEHFMKLLSQIQQKQQQDQSNFHDAHDCSESVIGMTNFQLSGDEDYDNNIDEGINSCSHHSNADSDTFSSSVYQDDLDKFNENDSEYNEYNSFDNFNVETSSNSSIRILSTTTYDINNINEFPMFDRNYQEARYKTELCLHFREKNDCPHGKRCLFAHGLQELRPYRGRHPKHKTQPCRAFHQTGYCNYGYRCSYLHSESPRTIDYINKLNNHAQLVRRNRMQQMRYKRRQQQQYYRMNSMRQQQILHNNLDQYFQQAQLLQSDQYSNSDYSNYNDQHDISFYSDWSASTASMSHSSSTDLQ